MNPYEIAVLLHYYVKCTDHPDIERTPPIWRPTIERFQSLDLLKVGIEGAERVYDLTDRGRVYIEKLLTIPLPEQSWGYPD